MDLSSLLVLFSIIWTCILVLTSSSRARKSANHPPGPYPFPIIGNILELGSKPHESLAKLSKTYGPLMSLKLGTLTTIVISSPEIAKKVLQTNDLSFSSRNVPNAAKALDHYKVSMVWLPVHNQWRKLRKICKEQMFSVPSLDASGSLRKQKLDVLSGYLLECSRKGQVVDVGEAAFATSLNLMSSSLFSKELAPIGSSSLEEMKQVMWGVMKSLGSPNLADYFSVLGRLDPQGIKKETEFYFAKLIEVFDGIIDEKLKSRAKGEKHVERDMLEALLDINQKDEQELSRNVINNLLIDLFVAGTDTTSSTVEWAMAELLRNTEKMSRVRDEIRDVIGENGQVQESDIPKLPYLQAVVKETFRLHPAAPFLVPHRVESDIEIKGYILPRNAQVLVNVWAIGRDTNLWPKADSFNPERFLDDRDIDFRGKDFELIPFGSGRRICPGLPLAAGMVPLMLATFVHKFEWKLEDEIAAQEIDMTERFGLTLQKAIRLKAIPVEL